jgi:hypothetical protein
MRTLSYSGASVLTTDGVAHSVLDYARALIAENLTDLVDIPVLRGDTDLTATLIIGPGSQLIVIPAPDHEVGLSDELPIAMTRTTTSCRP